MHTNTCYSKILNKMIWPMALLLAVFTAGCGNSSNSGNAATDTTAPRVSSTIPDDLATGVANNTDISASFSEPMDSATITAATFTLTQGTSNVAGVVTYADAVATFNPTGNLAANTIFTATINTGARDIAGNALAAAKTWSFTTGAVILTEFQSDILQIGTDQIGRAEDSFPVVLRNGSGSVNGNTYLLNMYYTDHISYLDYDIEVPDNSTPSPFKSFDNGQTYKVLHASGIDDTHIEVIFNRNVNTTDGADNALFTVPELTVSNAQVDGTYSNIVLLTTDAQGDDTGYVLTVASAFRDSGDNSIGSTGNTASFNGFAATALPAVRDVYMRTPAQIRVVFGNTAPSGSYTVSIKMNGVMRWLEDGSKYTYPNVISIQNYGILLSMEKLFDPEMAGYSDLLDFARMMGDNLIILGQPVIGKSGLDRRRSSDTSYLVKLYQLSGDVKYLDQAKFNFDNEIKIYTYSALTGGAAWAKYMVDVRLSLAGYDIGFYMNSALAIASVDSLSPDAKAFATDSADYMIANETSWVNVLYGGYDYTRSSVGAFCYCLTELVRLYPDLEPVYSAKITDYVTDILSWQNTSGYFEDGTTAGFDPQTTAFCLLAMKGAGSKYGVNDAKIQAAEDYIMEHYLYEGTVQGGWYFDNNIINGLYNESASELIWALSL